MRSMSATVKSTLCGLQISLLLLKTVITVFRGDSEPHCRTPTGNLKTNFGKTYIKWSGRELNPRPLHCERSQTQMQVGPIQELRRTPRRFAPAFAPAKGKT